MRDVDASANETLALVARLAAELFKVPFAAVAIRDDFGCWTNIVAGVVDGWNGREIPLVREASLSPDVFLASAPSEFPLKGAQTFAGVASAVARGVGALVVADTKPRDWNADQTALLKHLGAVATDALKTCAPQDSDDAAGSGDDAIVFSVDLNGRFLTVNHGAEIATGYGREELDAISFTDLLEPAAARRFWDRVAEQLGSGLESSHEITIQHKQQGPVRLFAQNASVVQNGRPAGLQAVGGDITSPSMQTAARRRAERQLDDKTRELAVFSDHLRQLHRLSTTDHESLDQLYADYLRTGCEIFRLQMGVIARAASGRFEVRAVYPSTCGVEPGAALEWNQTLCGRMLDLNGTLVFPSEDGGESLEASPECYIGTPIYRGGELFGSLSFCSQRPPDVRRFMAHDHEIIELMAKSIGRSMYEHRLRGDRKQLTEKLADQVRRDSLTGIPNRIYFSEELERIVAEGRDSGRSFAVLFIDLDRFKQINDTLGHGPGDLVLEQVAARLLSALEPNDCAARMGGDEFTVVLRNRGTKEQATEVVQRILERLRSPYNVDDYELFVTASIGVSLYPSDGEDARTLLQRADAAMYRAKGQGKNDFAFYGPDLALRTMNRLDLENQLRRALEKGELQMCFQPLVGLDGSLDGLEALLAWENPKFGKIGAARFIPIAEESGMIVRIGGWVLREACRQNAKWQSAGYPPLRLSVNVSVLQFARSRPVLGNHEYVQKGAGPYFDYWGDAAGDRTKGYYSFDLGSWHLIALNSNCSDVGGCSKGSPMEQWLRDDLAAHPSRCILAFWHHPRFYSPSRQPGSRLEATDKKMQAFWLALHEAGADVVLNGHRHIYERFARQNPDANADPAGIRQFVVGTGGGPLDRFEGPTAANSEIRKAETYGVLQLTLHAEGYDWRFVPVAGDTFTDAGSDTCGPASPPPPQSSPPPPAG